MINRVGEILNHLRRAATPLAAREIAENFDMPLTAVESVLNELKRDGKAAQLISSSRWEPTMVMPAKPYETKGRRGRRS